MVFAGWPVFDVSQPQIANHLSADPSSCRTSGTNVCNVLGALPDQCPAKHGEFDFVEEFHEFNLSTASMMAFISGFLYAASASVAFSKARPAPRQTLCDAFWQMTRNSQSLMQTQADTFPHVAVA
jgi:hypothetical protein